MVDAKIDASAKGVTAEFRRELNRMLMWMAGYHLASIVAIVSILS